MSEDPPKIDMELVREAAAKRAESCRAIGKFLFEFSQLEFTIRAALSGRLRLSGELFDVVTNECKALYNKCKALNDHRVKVAHGLWTEGQHGLVARHVNRHSLEAKYFFEEPGELHKLSDQAQQLMHAVLGFKGS